MPAYATGCSMPMAGQTANCSKKSSNALVNSCLAASFDLMCPGNAMANMAPDFVTANGIKCRTCDGGVMDVTDKDPRANSIAVSFTFGDLQDDSSTATFPSVSEYQVRITDSHGRVNLSAMPLAVIKPQAMSNPACCKPMAYRVKLTSGIAVGQRIALTARHGEIVLPPFQFSAAIADDSGVGKQVKVSRGTFTLTMGDAASLNAIAKPEGKEVFAAAFADSINLPRDTVFINKIDIIRRTRQNEMVRDYARRGLDNFGKELDGPRDVTIHGPISLPSRTDWVVWQRKRPPVPRSVMKKCLLYGVRAVELGMTEEEKKRHAEFEAFKKTKYGRKYIKQRTRTQADCCPFLIPCRPCLKRLPIGFPYCCCVPRIIKIRKKWVKPFGFKDTDEYKEARAKFDIFEAEETKRHQETDASPFSTAQVSYLKTACGIAAVNLCFIGWFGIAVYMMILQYNALLENLQGPNIVFTFGKLVFGTPIPFRVPSSQLPTAIFAFSYSSIKLSLLFGKIVKGALKVFSKGKEMKEASESSGGGGVFDEAKANLEAKAKAKVEQKLKDEFDRQTSKKFNEVTGTSEETSEEEISPHDLRTWGRTKKTDSGDYV